MDYTKYHLWDGQENFHNCIYAYVNKETGKAYVGQAVDFVKRHIAHLKNKRARNGIDGAINKYGFDMFEVRILDFGIPMEELNDREAKFVEELKSFEDGYNQTPSGHYNDEVTIKEFVEHPIKQVEDKRFKVKEGAVDARFATRICGIRKLKKIPQKQLAEIAGISVTTLNRIEQGEDCAISTIVKIERALNTKLF